MLNDGSFLCPGMLYGLMGIMCDIIVEPPGAGPYSTRKAPIQTNMFGF